MIFPLYPNPGLNAISAGLKSIPGGRTGSPPRPGGVPAAAAQPGRPPSSAGRAGEGRQGGPQARAGEGEGGQHPQHHHPPPGLCRRASGETPDSSPLSLSWAQPRFPGGAGHGGGRPGLVPAGGVGGRPGAGGGADAVLTGGISLRRSRRAGAQVRRAAGPCRGGGTGTGDTSGEREKPLRRTDAPVPEPVPFGGMRPAPD